MLSSVTSHQWAKELRAKSKKLWKLEAEAILLEEATLKDLRKCAVVEAIPPNELAERAVRYYLENIWARAGVRLEHLG